MNTILDPRRREAARLAELNRLGAVRPEADRVLQELVDDAREVFGTELCMVNLVASDEQYFRAWSGELPPELAEVRRDPRGRSMCRYVVDTEKPFVVEDFLATERFKDQHFRVRYGVRFYAGTPLTTADGHAIGSLCLMDSRPREFGNRDLATLRAFARAVVGRLETLGAVVQERNAKESEKRYRRNVFELANDAILIYSTETGFILDANRRACEMYGIPQEKPVGKKIAELSLDSEEDERHSQELPQLGTQRGFETLHRRADGTWMHVSINLSVIEYDGQRAILSINRDITGRKRMEGTLRRREKSLAEAQRIACLGSWEHALGENLTRWSDEMYRIFGLDSQSFSPTYKAFMLFIHPDDRKRIRGAIRGALRGGGPEDVEYRIVRPDGEVRFVHTQYEAVYDGAGRPVKFFGTVQDVTDSKQVEQKLREAEETYRLLVEQIPAVAYIDRADVPDAVSYTSPRIEALLGYTPEEWLGGRLWLERLHPDDREWVLEVDTRARAAEEPFGEEYRLIARDGSVVWVRDESALLRDEEGRPLLWQGVLLDITERKEAEAALRESEERLQKLTDAAFEGIIIHDGGEVLEANKAYAAMHGYEISEIVGRSALEWAAPEYRALVRQHILSGYEEPYESAELKKDGTRIDVEVRGKTLFYRGRTVRVTAVRDVTERKRFEEALRQSEARFRTIFERSAMGISITDLSRRFLETNPAYQGMLGYSGEELLGKPVAEISHPEDVPEDGELNGTLLAGDLDFYRREKRYVRKDGEVIWVCPTISTVRNAEGEPQFLIGMVEDITERKMLVERLEYQAFHDPLTGLPNRALFMDRLEHALSRAKRERDEVAVLFLDVDNLKVVNDTLGHEAGDTLLTEATGLLKMCLRPADTVARLSGDEFAILLEDVEDVSEATRVAERVAEALRAPLTLKGRKTFITASVGIALSGSARDSAGGSAQDSARDQAETLLRQADLAMYRAKNRGKAHHEVFDPGMNASAFERLEMGNDLRRALERDEFRVCYQPKMRLHPDLQRSLRFSGRLAIVAASEAAKGEPSIAGMEALVRWEHPERGLLSPKEFVPAAEESGMIVSIGRRVLEEACRQARTWQERYATGEPLVMCVNISARQFQHPDLAQDVARVLQQTGLEPRFLQLEITESVVMEDVHSTLNTLRKLEGLGIQLAVDDFGTGYSSLSYLKRFPVSVLKIDRLFVEPLGEDPEDAVMVSGIISLAHALGMQVVAEGVESAQQLAYLQGMGCDMVQGNYFSEPLPSEAASALLAEHMYTPL